MEKDRGTIEEAIGSVAELEDILSEPTEGVVRTLGRLEGDIIVLGVGGKMGPTLARMAKRASDAAGVTRKVIGVDLKAYENPHGIEPLACDLHDQKQIDALPDAPNVVYMVGMKFGATGQEAMTWATNAFLPGVISQRFRTSRIVAFSTGNVYGLTPVVLGGSREGDEPRPEGDYAMSCLGRERIFEHFSRKLRIPMAIIRLNYANELRYGVMVDLAEQVLAGKTVDLAMGDFNAIWQADACAMVLQAFDHVSSPPFVVNVAGPEMLSVRRVCEEFARLMDVPVSFAGAESADALLSSGGLGHRLFGYPRTSAQTTIRRIAAWVKRGGERLGKPTHFEVRDGKF